MSFGTITFYDQLRKVYPGKLFGKPLQKSHLGIIRKKEEEEEKQKIFHLKGGKT